VAGRGGPGQRETYKERLARRAAIDDPDIVMNAAARYLEVRSRSVEELRRHLGGAGYRPELVEPAVARLIELRVLDDEAFARTWIESRDRSHPRSERVLRQELHLKGVDRDVIDRAMADREDRTHERLVATLGREPSDDELAQRQSANEAAAKRLLLKRAAPLARVADARVRRQRAYALLARNGFDPDVCREAVVEFEAELAAGDGGGADRREAADDA